MKISGHILLITLMTVVFSSCNKENAPDCIQAAGDFKTVTRTLEAFSSIELRDYLQIELCDAPDYYVEITAPGNLIPDIQTNVDNGRLKIENENTCNFVRSFKKRITVRICAPSFPDIQNYGTGDIKCINRLECPLVSIDNRNAAGTIDLDVKVDSIHVSTHTGVCDVNIKGESGETYLFSQGVGVIDARHLISANAFVNNSSINDVYVNTDGYFFAFIRYSGNIYYLGHPNHIDSDIREDGELIFIE